MTIVLIPAYNAESSIPGLLCHLTEYISPPSIYVVDDGSTDRTADVARAMGAHVLRQSKNSGKGAALKKGFETFLSLNGSEAVITMDADLQHSPSDVPAFLDARKRRGANIVVGYRRRRNSPMPLSRRMSNSITSWLTTARTGIPILDSQCGFRLIGREVLEAISIESNGYEAETEILIKAARHGFRIEFLPIQTIYSNEKSHITHFRTTKQFLQTLLREY